jgi:hypothetical protein
MAALRSTPQKSALSAKKNVSVKNGCLLLQKWFILLVLATLQVHRIKGLSLLRI